MDIAAIFKQYLGRDVTPQELSALNGLLGGNEGLKDFDLGQIIQGLPEAQAYRNKVAQGEFGNLLAQNDQTILGQAADMATLNARRRGVADSSSIGAQIAQAGAGLAQNRGSAIAQFYQNNFSPLAASYAALGQNAQNFRNQYRLGERQFELDREMFNMSRDASRDAANAQNKDWLGKAAFQGGIQLLGDGMKAYAMSDRRAKENIVEVGKVGPLTQYAFTYKPGLGEPEGRHIGFMADEVEQHYPEAVIVRADGYKMVDYGHLAGRL